MRASEPPSTETPAERFYGGAPARIRRFILVLSVIGVVTCLFRFGRAATVGFVLGAVISYVNHVWLEGVVSAIGEGIITGRSREHGGGIVVRAGLRYALIALGAYVIFKVSKAGLYGFLGGICVTIGAVACEAAVEIYAAVRRGL